MTSVPRPAVVLLMGPTGAGKTDLAVALVDRGPFAIVSVDSALVYRGMDIGTAKPGPDVLARAPHRLIDIRDPAQAYSAAEFAADAGREIEAILASGRIPLLVGGTGLYFRALARGLARLPPADPAVRARLQARIDNEGLAAMHQELRAVDPVAAMRIHPHDSQRIQRALEVHELTGRPLSELLAAGAVQAPWRLLRLVLAPADRTALHVRLADRFAGMLACGFLDEVRQLRARPDLRPDLPSMRVVGYRQAWEYLAGTGDLEAMTARAVAATRQLAKRQYTWLRSEPDCAWLEAWTVDLPRRAETALRRAGLF